MRRLVTLAVLLLALCSVHAANQYAVVVEFTGVPADADTVVVNGTTATFKTVVTSASTQIEIGGTAAETAANLTTHFQDFPLAGVTPVHDPTVTTRVYLVAEEVDDAMTASVTGAWGTATVNVDSLTQMPVVLPLSLEPATQDRTNIANYILFALRDFSNTNFPAGAAVLVNYLDLSTAQTVTGAKTFTGAGIYSNANQRFVGGTLSNTLARLLFLDRSQGETNNAIYFRQGGGNLQSAIQADANGYPSLYLATALTDALTNALNITPSEENILNAKSADFRYPRKATTNSFSQAQTFVLGIVLPDASAVIDGGRITNMLGAEFDTVWIWGGSISNVLIDSGSITNMLGAEIDTLWINGNTYSLGELWVTNDFPKLSLYDADAALDEKRTQITASDGELRIQSFKDDQSGAEVILSVDRTGIDIDQVNFPSGTLFAENFRADTLAMLEDAGVENYLRIGSTNNTGAAGLTAAILLENAGNASADPTNAVATWANAGSWHYRQPGSGANYQVHNAASQVVGAGTDYPFTGSYAQVTFGSGGNTITLPSAGTYLLSAVVAIDNGATANDNYALKFFNATTAADITSSERQISNVAASTRTQITLQNVVTVAAASTIHLYGRNVTAARGSIDSEQTTISYVRLY